MQNNIIPIKTPINNKKIQIIQKENLNNLKETPKEKKLTEKEMKKILIKKHNEELLRQREILKCNPQKVVKKDNNNDSFINISDKYLKKQINLNRDILLYEKKWLSDREYKFFFGSIYYQNILATDLSWREDYKHLLFVRLMSYHNIGNYNHILL